MEDLQFEVKIEEIEDFDDNFIYVLSQKSHNGSSIQ